MSGLPNPGPNTSVFMDVVTDSNGYVTGMRRADGTVVPVAAPPPVVPTSATIQNGVLMLTASNTVLSNNQQITAGNVVGPQGNVGPLNTSNVLSYQQSAGGTGTISMASGKAVLTITGSTLIATQTVKLPPSPSDGQFVRISSQAAITLLTVQDASGNSTGTAFALSALNAGCLYQYQNSAWVRIA